MEENMAPSVIAGKDLDYLSDMFQWNYIAYKKTTNDISKVMDDDIKGLLIEAESLFYDNMVSVLDILGGEMDE